MKLYMAGQMIYLTNILLSHGQTPLIADYTVHDILLSSLVTV